MHLAPYWVLDFITYNNPLPELAKFSYIINKKYLFVKELTQCGLNVPQN